MENLDYSTEKWAKKQCPPINCHKKQCKCGLEKVFLASALGDDSEGSPIAPKNGAYCNAIVVYEANGHIYIYTAEGVPVSIGIGEDGLDIIDKELATLQQEIDDLKNSPDVVDIVPTYAALQAYDTSKLGDNDIIRVLQDETHDGQSTYYRWNAATSSWTYIGAVGAYYTKDQIDALLSNKQNVLTAGSNITISGDTISATDTTYTAGTGLTLTDTTFAIDTDVVATKSDLPTVNDATLTINQNGVNKGTFTANDADNVTVNLTDTTYTAGNAINIASNVISADIYPADYFTAGATVTGTGSSVTLNKTIPAKLESVELNSDTKQQSYNGKNKLAYSLAQLKSVNISGTWTDNQYSFNGVTYTVNGDLTVTGNGTATGASYLILTNSLSLTTSENYILNGSPTGGSVSTYSIRLYDGGNYQTENGSGLSFTYGTQNLVRINVSNGTQINNLIFEPMIRLASETSSVYEPYVGGIPAPNPDYPQDIHVVTGEQTVTVTGKNLCNFGTDTFTRLKYYALPKPLEAGTYTFSAIVQSDDTAYNTCLIRFMSSQSGSDIAPNRNIARSTGRTSVTVTTTATMGGIYLYSSTGASTSIGISATFTDMQLEKSSTATPFQPYQSQSYTVDLGSTELCKISNYQDYIYKSGDDWYVHKTIGKSELGSLTWNASGPSATGLYRMYTYGLTGLFVAPPDNNTAGVGVCSHFIITANNTAQGSYGGHISLNLARTGDAVFAFHPDYTESTSGAGFKTWLTDNSVVLYYALTTPTDTQITDATLIGQLDALANANSYLDATSFVVTATGTNLPAILDVSAYRNSAKGVALRPDIAGEDQTIVELTADMYNWNSSSQTATEPYDSIALWLLDVGAYKYTDINIPVYKASYIQLSATGLVWVTPPQAGTGFIGVISLSTDSSEITYSFDLASDGTLFSQYVYTDRDSMLASVKLNIVNIQTSAAPTTSDSGVIGQLWVYVDGNSDPHLYICTEIDTGVEPTEYIWEELQSGGGGGDTVYSDKSTSNASNGGAVYIGNLDSNQQEQPDPTTTDNHYRYFYALPYDNPISAYAPKNGSINILGECKGESSVVLGFSAYDGINAYYQIAIGQSAHAQQSAAIAMGLNAGISAENSVAIGRNAVIDNNLNRNSVALGSYAKATRRGEVNIGTNNNNLGYNNTDYRVIGGVHDGQTAHDAATVAQGNTLSASAPDSNTVGVLGQLWTDTTNMHTYQCTAISGSTYTWTMRW